MAESPLTSGALSRAWYSDTIAQFLESTPNAIVGRLTTNCGFALLPTQLDAWLAQVHFLQQSLHGLKGSLLMEFAIPRIGRRIDVVLLIGPIAFAIEFKVGESVFERSAIEQVWDYALDLKNFHEASHTISIVPILIATSAQPTQPNGLQRDNDNVYRPVSVSTQNFRKTIDQALEHISGDRIDANYWAEAPYHPTPTIIEAARALYAQHSVEAIARYDA
jgi:hypothetical protein